MAYQEEYTDEVLREKMKLWFPKGLRDDIKFMDMIFPLLYLEAKPIDIESEIRDLKRRVRELERIAGEERKPTKADYVYELFEKELEEKHFGKIVAIDIDAEEIVGIGNTVLEAYHKAKEKTGKTKFAYKRVGYDYVYKLR